MISFIFSLEGKKKTSQYQILQVCKKKITYFKLFSIQESIKILELKNFENNGNNISEFIHDIFDFL